ncbi:MAG: anhydro-N-acetylmuramic acid kinase [Pseudomonadota bacterium]
MQRKGKGGPIWALGAMSGTSLDGVDAAMVRTDGVAHLEFGDTAYRAYADAERSVLRAALGKWTGAEVEAAAEVVETAHAELLSQFSSADLIGFHGQTLAHEPDRGRTLQVGNGALLAETLEAPVVWDFRSTDMEMGGQGAPLAPFYHFVLAKHIGATQPIAFLNLGGVGNLTWLDPRATSAEAHGACLAFDTGPANAKMDDLMAARRGGHMDEGGALAASGTVDGHIVDALITGESYFAQMPPKSLDRDDFSGWLPAVERLSDADALATLAAASAGAVANGLEHCPTPPARLLVTGGGRKNAELMRLIAALVECPVQPVEDVGLDGDMLEAQAFAYLAVRVSRGLPTTAPGTTRVRAPVGGGQISRPGTFRSVNHG